MPSRAVLRLDAWVSEVKDNYMNINRRSKIYIRPDVQNSFIKFLIAFWLISLSMTVACLFFILMAVAVESGDATVLNMVIHNVSQNPLVVLIGFLGLILFALGFGYWFFRSFTTKICGPIYNIHLRVQEKLDGKPNVVVKIREDDFYHDFVEDINKLLQK